MKYFIILALLAPLVGACSAEHRAAIGYAEQQAKDVGDTKAQILISAPCAMSVGSYWRSLTNEQRRAIDTLCER